MSKLSGFPEYLPAERNLELAITDQLRRTFELHGFNSVETRAVEPLDQLLQKGEIDKEVYVLRRLQAADSDSDAGLGLHFDLTVPLARYVVENAGKLTFPFRRYQIQKVWRGERPQAGRFREFTQADIDIIADGDLPFHFDVEVAAVMADALSQLPVPSMTLQVNNRKLLEGFYLGVGAVDPVEVMRVMDKLDKLPADVIGQQLIDTGLSSAAADKCLQLASIVSSDTSFVERVRALDISHPLLDEGLDELAAVVSQAGAIGQVTVTADLRIARGLDYYTGTVFETRMTGYEQLGSVCSGGRYEKLASTGKRTYPGVGISLGVSRLLAPLLADGLTTSRSVPSVALIALDNEESRPEANAVAQQLRQRGIAVEVAVSAAKFGKQIRYAERRGIPFVWFPSTSEVKDIRTGDQEAQDPNTWAPPPADLRPQVIGPHLASSERAGLSSITKEKTT